MIIGMDPVAFSLGTLQIRWYGVMVVLAVIAILAISLIEAKRLNIKRDDVFNIATFAIIGGVIFARVIHVIDQWEYYMAHPEQLLSFEGVGVYGAVIGVLLAIVIYCLVKKISIWKIADMVSPGALIGMAIGRIGCTINGCCYGLETDSFCQVIYTHPESYAPLHVSILPTQIFHVVWNLIAFGIIWAVRKRMKPEGTTFLLYLALYGAGDLTIRFFRDGTPFMFGMQQAQVIGILLLVITVPWLIARMVLYRKKIKSEDTGEVNKEKSPEG
jgi:phosphatidylglycerol---prolipoprotein diacylglyceryl transferase